MWAGAALSGLAHAGLIALAAVAPPWLRPHRERPVPAVAVALVTPAAFDAAVAALARPEPVAARPPPAAEPAPPVPAVAPPPEAEPEAEPEGVVLPSLAPGFDPESPLGLADRPTATDLPAHRPRPRPGSRTPAAAPADAAAAAAAFEAAVRAAVLERLGRPLAGGGGTVRLALIVNRDGRLLAARMLAGSGSAPLDRAAVEAARTALLPAMPDAMPNTRATVEVELVFAPAPAQGG
jgi:protein TonB